MNLDRILAVRHRSDVISRASWYNVEHHFQPQLLVGTNGWVRQELKDNDFVHEPYTLTDEDRLADDWIIVQGNEPPA